MRVGNQVLLPTMTSGSALQQICLVVGDPVGCNDYYITSSPTHHLAISVGLMGHEAQRAEPMSDVLK